MTLREKQSLFASKVPDLIAYAYSQGYELALGDAFAFNLWTFVLPLLKPILSKKRYKWLLAKAHSKRSFHYKKVAIDLHLFKDGKYLEKTDDHAFLGEYWESLHPDCTWGGRFKRKDGNHYSWGER